ncbi:MAG: hypothetical protein VR72_07045 [Clostridiaceae bacterium BRH_c20a]|nr:MAG: hypothetical protein VR72_07045 [Clostridiaceae bacterium BRH_c20a]
MEKNPREGWLTAAFEQSRKKFQQLSPEIISKVTLLPYDQGTNSFSVESFGHKIQIEYPEGQMFLKESPEKPISIYWELILLNYLSHAAEIPLQNEWVSYRELPHGNLYYRNIMMGALEPLGRFFTECDKALVPIILTKLGFTLLDTKADVAARGEFVPRIPVLIQFWEGEEGIPSTCQILLDRTTSDQMHIEDTGALCRLIKALILEQYAIEKK